MGGFMKNLYNPEVFDFRLKPLPATLELVEMSLFTNEFRVDITRRNAFFGVMADNRGQA